MAPNNLKPIDKLQHRHNKSPLSQGYRKPQWPELVPKKTRFHSHSIVGLQAMKVPHESTCSNSWFVIFWIYVCRVEDYWEGYKLFCYAYYLHSFQHESEFQQSELGSWFCSINLVFVVVYWFALPFRAPMTRYCMWLLMASTMAKFAQGSLCGDNIVGCLFPPIICSALHACNFCLLWKCIVSGSWKRTATILDLSYSGSTPNWSWKRMNWDARFCLWFEMTIWVWTVCRNAFAQRHNPTHSMLSERG